MLAIRIVVSVIAAYCLGSIASAIILSKSVLHQDIRGFGSGSAGATNMFRTFGAKWGAITLIADALKGYLAYWLAYWIGGATQGGTTAYLCASLAGMAAIAGHNWPIFYGFKGGKGIAVSLGVMLAVHPSVGLLCLVVGLGLAFTTGYMSIGSLVALGIVFIDVFFVAPWPHKLLLLFIVVLDTLQHRANIVRLLQGKENRVVATSLFDKLRGSKKTSGRDLK